MMMFLQFWNIKASNIDVCVLVDTLLSILILLLYFGVCATFKDREISEIWNCNL